MSKSPLAIIILAAGQGKRMKSARPKVMHELAGRPMIAWLLDTAESLKPEKIIVVAGPGMKELEEACRPHDTVIQKPARGTADAVKAALPALGDFRGDVLVLLGDTPLVTADTLRRLVEARSTPGSAETKAAPGSTETKAGYAPVPLPGLSLLGCIMKNPEGYGRLILNEDGTLGRIVEDKDANAEERAVTLVNAGAMCFDGARLPGWLEKVDSNNKQDEFYVTQIPAIVNAEGGSGEKGGKCAVVVIEDEEEVRGCNTRADQAALEKTLQGRLRRAAMESGVSMIDPDTVYLHHDTEIASGVLIEPSVFFGPGVKVEEGAHIKAFSHIEGAHIGKNVSAGPFARLRPGSTIGHDARIGNFVEVKKSRIGAHSKINHLAYVGDCDMGDDVNFSAGAITVNYDGFEKHKTRIGKGVMVGSNVNLVAPINIDDGAFIAAGSTITKNVPADALSIGRDVSRVREGWAKEYRKRKKAVLAKLKKKKKSA